MSPLLSLRKSLIASRDTGGPQQLKKVNNMQVIHCCQRLLHKEFVTKNNILNKFDYYVLFFWTQNPTVGRLCRFCTRRWMSLRWRSSMCRHRLWRSARLMSTDTLEQVLTHWVALYLYSKRYDSFFFGLDLICVFTFDVKKQVCLFRTV